MDRGRYRYHRRDRRCIVIGVFAFLAGAVLTLLCLKLKAAKAVRRPEEGERLK